MSENYQTIATLAQRDVETLKDKGKTYGSSWKKRGGVGAFMMLARKWDRIENIVSSTGYDIFKAGTTNTGDVLDDIADLRAYLLLVESEVINSRTAKPTPQHAHTVANGLMMMDNSHSYFTQAQQSARMGKRYEIPKGVDDGSEATQAYVNQG